MQKDITDFIYEYSSFEEILGNYITYLRNKKDIDSIQHAMKLTEYQNIRLNKNLINHIKEVVFDIDKLIKKNYPKLQCEIQLRVKSLRHSEEKIKRNILLGRSIDIKDFIGIRVIFFNDNTLKNIFKCYEVIASIIESIMSKSCLLCQAEDLVDTDNFDNSMFPDIIVPLKKDIETIPNILKYSFGFKDYILNPKNNGYQSVHVVFKTEDGNFFEIQFRNIYMHQLAECSVFSHDVYKKTKYKNIDLNIDPFKIHTKHYHSDINSGKYCDYDGILEPLQLLVLST